ncbi:MAG: hypothetical protein U0270_34110 [Labilithrix sp.]
MRSFALVGLLSLVAVTACERPFVGKDGTVYLPEKGAGGAGVVNANGEIEYHDRYDVPTRVVSKDPNEPWRAPIGFILPADGVFRETSKPHVLATQGLAIVLRPSDTRVPSWGGEVLVRVDIIAPAADGTARWGENVALVIDGDAADTTALADVALERLAGRDRVTIVDSRGARVIVPSMPAGNRSMAVAAIGVQMHATATAKRDLVGAIVVAGRSVAGGEHVNQRVLVLTDKGLDPAASSQLELLKQHGVHASAVSTLGRDDLDERSEQVRTALPAAGDTMFRSVTVSFQGTPAPSHVLEASGGEAVWRLDAGDVLLGNVRAGEARTEMLRVSVPPWVPGEKFHFTVSAHVDDLTWGGPRDFSAEVPCVYDDDIERIAKSRHGDVIAYASAMATLKRLDSAFSGANVSKAGGLRKIAEMHARSMQMLARDSKDFATQEQADMLVALLAATTPR